MKAIFADSIFADNIWKFKALKICSILRVYF